MILRQKSVKPLLGQEIEHFWGKRRVLYEFVCILVQVGSLFSGSLQLSITHFPALLVFSSGPDYYSCTWFFHCYRKYLLWLCIPITALLGSLFPHSNPGLFPLANASPGEFALNQCHSSYCPSVPSYKLLVTGLLWNWVERLRVSF